MRFLDFLIEKLSSFLLPISDADDRFCPYQVFLKMAEEDIFSEPKPVVAPVPVPAEVAPAPAAKKKLDLGSLGVGLDLKKLRAEKEALKKKNEDAAAAASSTTSTTGGGGVGAAPDNMDFSTMPMTASTASGDEDDINYGSLLEEEYDPAEPNNYDEYCRRRKKDQAAKALRKHQEAAVARQAAALLPKEAKEEDFATKMMKKMGWQEGQGLGSDGQGMTAPLVMRKTDKSAGEVVMGTAMKVSQFDPTRGPSPVCVLFNVVGRAEVDDELEEEMADEARKFGSLKTCKIIVNPSPACPENQSVRVFLHFLHDSEARTAYAKFNGRHFAGRTVAARFYEEERFVNGDHLHPVF